MKMLSLLLFFTCGYLINGNEIYDLNSRSKKTPSHRIVGGNKARDGDHPWQVFVYDKVNQFMCGGTIISEDYILSAAHCFSKRTLPRKKSNFIFRVGNNDFRKYKRQILASNIVIHDLYNNNTHENDIALVKLASGLDLSSKYYQAMVLPDSNDVFDGHNCTVAGWGDTTGDGHTSDVLMEVNVPVLSDVACKESNLGNRYYKDVMLCAGYLKEGGKDSCQGDSGGPFFCKLDDGSKKLAGIVSWGKGCALKNYPGVYTRVSAFVHWIQQNMI